MNIFQATFQTYTCQHQFKPDKSLSEFQAYAVSSDYQSPSMLRLQIIWHVNNIPTMQLFTGISRYTESKLYMLSLTECIWDFQNNALWDTHQHTLLTEREAKKSLANLETEQSELFIAITVTHAQEGLNHHNSSNYKLQMEHNKDWNQYIIT